MRLVSVFCDNGESGTHFNRPGFERLMDAVMEKTVDCIVVKDLSRLGRNYIETTYYIENTFPFLDVRFISVQDHFDSMKNDSDTLMLGLRNIINDMFAKDISKKVSSSLHQRQLAGQFIGAFAPYGYEKSPECKHKLIVAADVAGVVQDIFKWRCEGVGYARIARMLNERGILSPAMWHYQKGHYKKNKPEGSGAIWQGQIIKRICSDPVYLGHIAQGKTKKSLYDNMPTTVVGRDEWLLVKNTHEAIVDQEIFDLAQAVNKERHDFAMANQGKYPTTENVFRGLVYCADCNTKMNRYKSVAPSGTAQYGFLCRVYAENLDGTGCSQKWVTEKDLFEIVFRSLAVQVKLAMDKEKLLDSVKRNSKYRSRRSELETRMNAADTALQRARHMRGAVYESYKKGLFDQGEFHRMKKEYDATIEQSNHLLTQLKSEYEHFSKTISPQNEWLAAFKKHQAEKVLTRQTLLELVEKIIIKGYNEIDVIWKFQDAMEQLAGYIGGGAA